MDPIQIEAWTVAIEALIKVGGYAVTTVKGWFSHAQTDLTDDQIAAAWETIEADDRVRLAIAQAASGG
jgi:hypothetical protein